MLSSLIECDAKHKSLFSATPVFVHHHVFLGFFARRRVGGTRRLHHRYLGILPRTRGNSNDKVPTFFFFYVTVQFSRGNSRVQGAIKYVLYLDPFCSWTH